MKNKMVGSISAGIFSFLLAITVSSANALADGNSISGGNPGVGCLGFGSVSPQGYYAGTCSGVSWRYYDLRNPSDVASINAAGGNASDPNNVVMPSLYDGHSDGLVVSGCGSIGGFYYLGFEKHQGGQYLNQQVGSLTKDVIDRNPTQILGSDDEGYRGLSGLSDFAEVEADFNVAKTLYNLPDTWQTVGAFCYNEPDQDPENASGGFYTQTTAIAFDEDGPQLAPRFRISGKPNNGYVGTASENGRRSSVIFATDQENTKVVFRHYITYDSAIEPANITNPDNVTGTLDRSAIDNNGIHTEWKARRTAAYQGNTSDNKKLDLRELQTFYANNNSGTKVLEEEITIALKPGQNQQVCEETIIPKSKTTVKWNIEGVLGDPIYGDLTNPTLVTGHTTIYNATANVNNNQGGAKKAKVCVRVYRTKDPWNPDKPNEPDDPEGPSIINESSTNFMSVGEKTSIGWNAQVYTNRAFELRKFQAIAYQVNSRQEYKDSVKKVARRAQDAPCAYVRNTLFPGQIEDCTTPPLDGDLQGNNKYSKSLDLVVSNNLGDKYCNTVGFQFQYRYKVQQDGQGDWQDQAGRSHWFIPKSVCRTIAKKPSIAVWNGSLYASGKITGITADRYNNPSLRTTDAPGADNSKKLFGSWVEYLAVANKDITNFASGSALYQGNGTSEISRDKNSKLTIANNTNTLGQSGITASAEFTDINGLWDKLVVNAPTDTTHKQPIADTITGEMIATAANERTKPTKVFYKDGGENLNITNDIIINGNHNPNNVPMYIIIMKGSGTINISKDVSRIDAWIIAPSATLNTCSDFKPGRQNPSFDEGTAADSDCSKQLIFNGPVIVKNAQFKRTYGAEANPDVGTNFQNGNDGNSESQPAEIFNYRLDSYLWAIAQSSRYGLTFNEAYITELVPRQ